jgi:thiamine-monophosphate kinase
VLSPAGDVLISTDQLLATRHFDPDATPVDLIARKAMARALSDIAAMAGAPLAGVVAAQLPRDYARADELFDACHAWAERFGCPLVGGDIATTPGPLGLIVTVLGTPHATRGPVRRDGAQPGDMVCVTGALGGSLDSGRHLTFEPRLAEGRALAETLGSRLHAMIDLSDGLGIDAGRIARASGVRIELDADRLPRHTDPRGEPLDWRRAAADGEDYELLFTIDPSDSGSELPTDAAGTPITVVGRVADAATDADRGMCVIRTSAGETIDARRLGWDHGG